MHQKSYQNFCLLHVVIIRTFSLEQLSSSVDVSAHHLRAIRFSQHFLYCVVSTIVITILIFFLNIKLVQLAVHGIV